MNSVVETMKIPDNTLRYFLSAFLTGGHVLLEGFPGTGKTTFAKQLAKVIKADFKRIQFTADMLPSDILGGFVFDKDTSNLILQKGPVFTNILVADEINRSPPRTQSALLQSMDENQVTIDRVTYNLETPYFIVATQNPADIHGTFPLPENQLDRFTLKLSLEYLSPVDEISLFNSELLRKNKPVTLRKLQLKDVLQIAAEIKEVSITEEIKFYAAKLIAGSREHQMVDLGGSTRATFSLIRCSQALAYFENLNFVTPDYVRELFPYIIKHRLRLSDSNAELENQKDSVIKEIVESVCAPV